MTDIGARSALLAVFLTAAMIGCAPKSSSDGKQARPQPTRIPVAETAVAVEPGTYEISRSAWSVGDFTISIPEGWKVQYGHVYLKHEDSPKEMSFYPVVVDGVFADACRHDGEVMVDLGPGVDDLADALLEQPGPVARGPFETPFGGHPATRIDLRIPKALDLGDCRFGGAGLQIWYSPPADKYFVLLPGAEASVYILDLGGRRQVFMTQYGPKTPKRDLQELQTILDSIQMEA